MATLTLPTGMGKTLTGLSAAFTVRDAVGGTRVVYALPFTSVIDQVVDELRTIYETDATGSLLTAHHHLAEATDAGSSDADADARDRDDDVAGLLGESWRAGLTVTTFVQLFESLAGPRNRQSMKLPALRDSVLVLDEPQSLPLDWWKLVPRLVDVLVDQYGATVIAMTATQPRLFGESPELVDDYDYFGAVERVTYRFDDSIDRYVSERAGPKAHVDAARELRELPETTTALAVVNTIDSARALSEHVTEGQHVVDVADAYRASLERAGTPADVDPVAVADRVVDAPGRPFLHLSTRLRPADRLTLVGVAKALAARNSGLLTVSTQLIEAGVDISFDRVYRDFAPLDSIVQAAGRCNRSFERERGRVTVWWLDSPPHRQGTQTPAEAVYNRGTSLLPVTADVLEAVRTQFETLDETTISNTAVEKYYARLGEDGRDVGKRAWADYVDAVDAASLGSLSLIDQRRAADVLVCRTATDRERVDEIRAAMAAYDFEAVNRLLEETKPLRVSVPLYPGDDATVDAISTLPPVDAGEGLYELDTRSHGDYFDDRFGFVVPESTVDHQFL